ncbi:two-component system response regulator YesN [Fontibacillus phaseoli]|uniref:Two-component system response regulator YesN n=1 Tax=Fontibacillus phaseoli TaxID=1416533 RepID=A0A369BGB1_9BACL|nr:helix-turn-helix domain-containing protein [Fontibacillus phaseoli]RCX20590.1 two-component system response regulator YesN [Fontibacillus phaseoli]
MRALIVDDEARVRKAVRLLVDWQEHDIEEIEEAGSGREAIKVIKNFKPAIVIMDMMMSSGHGMELMAWVSEHAPSLKFIVISGHNDFEFVRSAVRHGGIDYILKPIEPEAINAAVAKAVGQWQSEERERREQQQKSIRLNEFRPVYGEKLLSSLIDDPGSAESAMRRLHAEGVIPETADQGRLLLVQIDSGDAALLQRFGNDSELLHFSLINICNEFLLPEGMGVAFKYWGAPMEIVILMWKQYDRAPELIARVNDGLFHTLQRRVHAGLGSVGQLPQSLPAQYAEADHAMRRRNLLQPDQYVHSAKSGPQDMGKGPVLSFSNVQEEWKTAIQSGDQGQIASAARHWIDALCRSGYVSSEMLQSWKSDILSFRLALLRETLGQDAGSPASELEQDDSGQTSPRTNSYAFSPSAWREWAELVMTRLAGEISRRRSRENRLIGEIITYIDHHYRSELSLQDIASHFYVSREYVSRKFKQEFGINFSDYLTNYRIDKAKVLMLNPDLKVQQIAEMVGFNDVKYFSKVFKKQEGMTPREYRNK